MLVTDSGMCTVIGHCHAIMLCVTLPADVTRDVACAIAVAMCWVYVVKQHYRCSEFNVESVAAVH